LQIALAEGAGGFNPLKMSRNSRPSGPDWFLRGTNTTVVLGSTEVIRALNMGVPGLSSAAAEGPGMEG